MQDKTTPCPGSKSIAALLEQDLTGLYYELALREGRIIELEAEVARLRGGQ